MLIASDGTPRLTDFGIARLLQPDGERLTRQKATLGTPGYMAPEQYRQASTADTRSDVFALGCILYELLTGTATFTGDDIIALYQQAVRMDFVPVDQLADALPPAIVRLIHHALRARPVERPADAGEMLRVWTATEVATPPTLNLPSMLEEDAPQPRHNLPAAADLFVGRELSLIHI